MTPFVEDTLNRAKQRILSREITSEATLTRFLERMASPAALVTGKYLIGAAIAHGLYQFVAEVYEASLSYAVSLAASAISCSAIRGKADLSDYLHVSAQAIANGVDTEHVFADIMIAANASGLLLRLRSERECGTRPAGTIPVILYAKGYSALNSDFFVC